MWPLDAALGPDPIDLGCGHEQGYRLRPAQGVASLADSKPAQEAGGEPLKSSQ